MQGVYVLMRVAITLEQIDPKDRYRPFCRSLLRLIKPLIEKDLAGRGFDQEIVDAGYQVRTTSGYVADPPASALDE